MILWGLEGRVQASGHVNMEVQMSEQLADSVKEEDTELSLQ